MTTQFYALQKLRASALQAIVDDRLLVTKPIGGDTSRLSSASLQADPHLTLNFQANYNYECTWNVYFSSPTAADIQFAISFPSGATTPFGGLRLVSTAATTGDLDPGAYSTATSGSSNLIAAGSAGIVNLSILKATIQMGGTAGAVTLLWAQSVSTASNTTVYSGSSFAAQRER